MRPLRLGIPALTLVSVLALGVPSQAFAGPLPLGWISPTTLTLHLGVGQTIEEDKYVNFFTNPYDPGGVCDGMEISAAEDCIGLDLSGVPDGVLVGVEYVGYGVVGTSYYFDVTFTGVTPGVYQFQIGATIMGNSTTLITPEDDYVTVPEPATLLLFGSALGFAGIRRRLKKRV